MSERAHGTNYSWTCSCGEEHLFDETPQEGRELECEKCGKWHEVVEVDWSAVLYIEPRPAAPEEKP